MVLDLDDTLYKEADFVASGFRAVLAACGRADDAELLATMAVWQAESAAVFDRLADRLGPQVGASDMLRIYREHEPDITLEPDASDFLRAVESKGKELAVITDGRSVTQRNKIAALGLDGRLKCVVISEEVGFGKPHPRGYRIVERSFPRRTTFTYIADNPRKDFIAPNALGWTTIQLDDDGRNVHAGAMAPGPEAEPQFHVSSLSEIVVK